MVEAQTCKLTNLGTKFGAGSEERARDVTLNKAGTIAWVIGMAHSTSMSNGINDIVVIK
jgi:hypothetical protein